MAAPKMNKSVKSQTVATPETRTATQAELVALSTLPLSKYVTKGGEERVGLRLHSVSYLPEKVAEDGSVQSARFGGFMPEWTDPQTGTVHGKNRDSIPVQFFGKAADDLAVIVDRVSKRDAILMGVNGNPEELFASIHRREDGSILQLAVGTREFRGNYKLLQAAPEAQPEEE